MARARLALIAATLVLLGACAAAPPAHLDREGRVVRSYDPARSFFPLGLYHALAGRHAGRDHDLAPIAAAGFNVVHPWEGQTDLSAFLDAARAAGLLVVPKIETLESARGIAGHPALLAWYVAEEPVLHAPAPDLALDRLPRVRDLTRELDALDPARAALVVEFTQILPPWRDAWIEWARAAPLHGVTAYPIVEDVGIEARRARISFPRGIPETIALSRANNPGRPVWLFVQAFASPKLLPRQRWLMPTPEEMRAMAYAGIVAGATGLFFFAHDSFVTRAGQVVGMGPDLPERREAPPEMLGATLAATPAEREAGARLWAAMPRLNAEIAALAPALLSPDAETRFSWSVRTTGTLEAPIRAVLKRHPDGGSVLIAVNHERADAEIRFVFERAPSSVAPLTPDSPGFELAGASLVARFAPFAVGVWRLPGTP